MIDTYELIAPCHFGLESVLKREIYDLGYDIVKVEDGKVTFIGDADAIARAADDKPEKKSRKAKETSTGPMIAYTEDGNIYMEPITKEVINDIRI